jgi:hypothetical protein
VLWDFCLPIATLVRSNFAQNIYQFKGQVPETEMTGRKFDISHMCEFEWYVWIMQHEDKGYPDDKARIGR